MSPRKSSERQLSFRTAKLTGTRTLRAPEMGKLSRRRLGVCAAALLVAGLQASRPVGAQGKLDREYQIKAAIILNFISFVDWSNQALPPNSPAIHVCVAGKDAYQTIAGTIQGKSLKGRRVTVSLFSGPQDLNGCQVLFISEAERARSRTLLEAARSQDILTIGEIAGFTKNGGVINISTRNNKPEFTINPGAAARANLSVSSQLLRLGKVEE